MCLLKVQSIKSEMETSIARLSEQLRAQTSRADVSESECARLRSALESAQMLNVEIQHALEASQFSLKESTASLGQQASSVRTALEADISALKAENENSSLKIEAQKESLRISFESIQSLQAEIQGLKQSVAVLQNEHSDSLSNLSRVSNQLARSEDSFSAARSTIQQVSHFSFNAFYLCGSLNSNYWSSAAQSSSRCIP